MALRNESIVYIGAGVLLALFALSHLIRKRMRFTKGVRVANTIPVKALSMFKRLRASHRILSAAAQLCLLGTVMAALVLAAEPYRTETVSEGVKKRDIFLCMDVSASAWSLNTELVHELKHVVENLSGDRFGVLIFNTSPLLYVPMTDDYDFISLKLDELLPFFAMYQEYYEDYYIYNGGDGYLYLPDDETREAYADWRDKVDYYSAPVTIDNGRKGSSLIGVGLASCLYSFPRFGTEDRTRIIILSTDNAEEALQKPALELPEAASLCAKNNVTVFGIFPDLASFTYAYDDTEYDDKRAQFKESVRATGGEYYEQSASLAVPDIVDAIRSHEAMRVEDIVIRRAVDQPRAALIALMACALGFFLSVTGLRL